MILGFAGNINHQLSRWALGKQAQSQKKSAPAVKFGNETREARHKVGMFAGGMTQQQAKIRIEHPKF